VIRDSIKILKGIPKVFVNSDKNKNTIFLVSPAENSKPPSGGTITTDRCLTHLRDAAHSESSTWVGEAHQIQKTSLMYGKIMPTYNGIGNRYIHAFTQRPSQTPAHTHTTMPPHRRQGAWYWQNCAKNRHNSCLFQSKKCTQYTKNPSNFRQPVAAKACLQDLQLQTAQQVTALQ